MSSSAPVALHPLVIVNISDHYTRHKLNATDAQAVGVLMGRQDGNKISLLDSVEVRVETVGAERALDRNHMNTRMSLFKAVYPNTEMMGWYLVGARHAEHDKGLHKQFQEFNESPLLLVLDPSENRMLVESEKKELPVSLFELRLQVVNERSETSFVPLPFRIETLDPERVTVDHIARGTVHRGAGSALTPHLSTLYNAVAMLKERVVLLRRYIDATKRGAIAMDRPLLREAISLCLQLLVVDSDALAREFEHDLDEASLIIFLSMVTKETAAVNGVLEKFLVANPDPGSKSAAAQARFKGRDFKTRGMI